MAGHLPIPGGLHLPPTSIAVNLPTDGTLFVDFFSTGPANAPTPVASFSAFELAFGGLDPRSEASYQIFQFFQNGGRNAIVLRVASEPSMPSFASALQSTLTGVTIPFNLLCIPATANLAPADMHTVMLAAENFCATRHAFYIADIPPASVVPTPTAISAWFANSGLSARDCAAIYYPRLTTPDPLHQNAPREIGCSGVVAGVYARTDSTHGVWKAPAGITAVLAGVTPVVAIDDAANGQLSSLGINAIRSFPADGAVLWGARTTEGSGTANVGYQYISVRRLALYLEQSLSAGLQWVVFEPNNPALWGVIRLAIDAFLIKLWQQGAFQGATSQQAFFVRCDATTTTQSDIANGQVNIVIGFAPLKPAEFVILNISQFTAPYHP